MSKPFGVCWCDCHTPVDDAGRRIFAGTNDANHVNGWPRFDSPVAMASACVSCRRDHILFIDTGRDWAYPSGTREPDQTGGDTK